MHTCLDNKLSVILNIMSGKIYLPTLSFLLFTSLSYERCQHEKESNLYQAFRSYDIILGDPLHHESDPGYQGTVFDTESACGNLAGHPQKSCSTSLNTVLWGKAGEFFRNTISSHGSSIGGQVGPDIEVSASISDPSNTASIGVKRRIPPLLQMAGSNSKLMQN